MEHSGLAAGGHRRSQSDAAGDVAPMQDTPVVPGHVRSVSLGSSASQFLQSLKLEPGAAQHDQATQLDQHTPAAGSNGADAGAAAAGAGKTAAQDRAAGQPSARSKRAHRNSNGRVSKDAMQLDEEEPDQQLQRFTPLPAVVENSPYDSERDWDSDSDREGFGPNRRGSRGGGRRGGCNGRSEHELMLLDPKQVKRILANRESAARSKERRLNYTVELEGKLQVLSVETDKLNSQLHSLSKQESKLRASKAELEQQVVGMQQQLAQVVSDNQALVATLYQLQAAMGLPQALPDCITPGSMQGAAAGAPPQEGWLGYQQQYTDSQPPASPKQRKPRRQSKHQQQQQQQQQQSYGWNGSSYAGGSSEPDLTDPAAAAAAPVAELPIKPPSKALPAAAAAVEAAQGHLVTTPSASAAAAAGAAGCHAAGSADLPVRPAAGSGTMPPPVQVSPRQHQWHTGLGGSSSNNSTPAVTPQPRAVSSAHPAASSAHAAGAGAGAAGAAAQPQSGEAGCSTAAAAAGAAAAGLVQQPAMLLLGQLPSPGADAVMGDAEDDIAMLGAFLEEAEEEEALGHDGLTTAQTAAAAGAAGAAATAAAVAASQQQLGLPYAAAPAAVGPAAAGGGAAGAAARVGPPAVTTVGPAGWSGHTAASGLPQRSPPAAAAAAGGGVSGLMPGGRPAGGGFRLRGSPALSEPVGGDFWRDDISSGSVGGSLTHSHTPNITPSAGAAAAGVNGVPPAYVSGSWLQQQQQQYGAAAAGVATAHSAALSPQEAGVAAAAAAASAVASSAAAGFSPAALSAAAAGMPQVSPLTPVSSRIKTPTAGAAGMGVAAVMGMSHSLDPMAAHSTYQQQQQQPGVDSAAQWAGRSRHSRSASTGCVVTGLGWQGYDQLQGQLYGQGSGQVLQQQDSSLLAQQQQQQLGQVHPGSQAAAAAAGPGAVGSGFGYTGLASTQGHTSLPEATLAAFSGGANWSEEVYKLQSSSTALPGQVGGQVPGQVTWQRHRRSHSHAAAFMGQQAGGLLGQFDFTLGQQQQQQQQQQLQQQQQQAYGYGYGATMQ